MNEDKIMQDAIEHFGGDQLAAKIWYTKYRLEGETHPLDMAKRCTDSIYPILKSKLDKLMESKVLKNGYPGLYNYISTFSKEDLMRLFSTYTIIPGGSILSGIGTDQAVSLSNCFVLKSPMDNYPSIMMRALDSVEAMKRRGGVGMDLSNLRPQGSPVNNCSKTSTGVTTFMDQYSNITNCVAQNGRRGALMLSLSIKHPDIMDFIKIKRDHTKITGANISIMMDEPSFMEKVIDYAENGKDSYFITRFPITLDVSKVKPSSYKLGELSRYKDGFIKVFKVSELWDEFIQSNWSDGDPGFIFKDHQDKYSPSHIYPNYRNACTNPCGEIMMSEEDSCRLLAINVTKVTEDPFTKDACVNDNKMFTLSFIAAVIGDCIVDLEAMHIGRIIKKVNSDEMDPIDREEVLRMWTALYNNGLDGRRIGLGVTGLGDVYAYLRKPYGDPDVNKQIFDPKVCGEWLASVVMAEVLGTFKGWDAKIDANSAFFLRLHDEVFRFRPIFNLMLQYGRRNVSISTCAPNGTTSLITQTTSGIEPVFMIQSERKRKVSAGEEYDYTDEVGCHFKKYVVNHKGYQDWLDTPDDKKFSMTNPYEGNEAHNIDYRRRVANQAQIQLYISHSISSTVNLPENIDKKVLSDIYILAWKSKLKGITIYRDGSKTGVITAVGKNDNKVSDKKFNRPETLPCQIIRMKITDADGVTDDWMAFISTYDNHPVEIFTGRSAGAFKLDKSVKEGEIKKVLIDPVSGTHRYDFKYIDSDGYHITIEGVNRCFNPEYYNYSKLISSMLKYNYSIDHVVNLLNDLSLSDNITGWKSAVMRALRKFIANGTKVNKQVCPECGSELIYIEGCIKCSNPECGYTKCGI